MNKYRIFVVSDGTGRTAEQALKAALTQFGGVDIGISKYPGVRSGHDVRRVVEEAAAADAFIIHTLVTDGLRAEMVRAGRRLNVEMIDLMGALLARLSERFHISPAEKPGLYSQQNRYLFRRIETMEFAINHDDGLRIHEIKNAEIVLLGVSRTFKTPLSVYLANKGWFVANVPVILDVELPREIQQVPAGNVFCLDTNPLRLADLRKARDEYLRGKAGEYAKIDFVRHELKWARKLFALQPGWRRLDVTNKPIEEIASEILSLKGVYDDAETLPE
jgi:[pyruvate, water dikinase]-phosphate phosphotransferase / [pyruvate, water dikinase] kinase